MLLDDQARLTLARPCSWSVRDNQQLDELQKPSKKSIKTKILINRVQSFKTISPSVKHVQGYIYVQGV